MWLPKGNEPKKGGGGHGLVAVAIDKDKGSQSALKWALDNLLSRGQTVVLIHVIHKSYNSSQTLTCDATGKQQLEKMTRDLFVSFHCYCIRKDVRCLDVVLEDYDVPKAITEYASYSAVENLVLGTSSRNGFIRKFKTDVPSSVSKGAPDFCTVYVISKGKISSMRNASRPPPYASRLLQQIEEQNKQNDNNSDSPSRQTMSMKDRNVSFKPRTSVDESLKSPFASGSQGPNIKPFADFLDSSDTDISFVGSDRPSTATDISFLSSGWPSAATDISFVSSGRPSAATDISFVSSGRPSTDRMSSVGYEYMDAAPRMSSGSVTSFGLIRSGPTFMDVSSMHDFSSVSHDGGRTSFAGSTQSMDYMEAEMRRLKQELNQTMNLYYKACKEALDAKQKAVELQRWRMEEERRLEEAKVSEEAALSVAETEKARYKAAMEAAEAQKRLAELEAQKRENVEAKALQESEKMKRVMDSLSHHDIRYRRYTIEEIEQATEYFAESRKIGEGGYGPVYKCYLDHTPVAVKVLRPDAAQGRSQFQREIEVLSLIRHPNMVLLLGACPEYGILVYEYMAKGSLDDRLFCRGNTPVISWQLRFRIAAEIATGLLFLHQTKPEPLVHRDLKPGNILLDSNYVCKISDVGLARLVPAVAENVTQCHITSTAGTFCYIDPEYQQTGMLGVKSDVYSLGILLLQLITAKPPMGLTHHVERAIENGTFDQILDPAVPDWPMEETLTFAKLSLQCAELRRKDRPDLGKVVLPELSKLREFAEEKMSHAYFVSGAMLSSKPSHVSMSQAITPEVMSDPLVENSASSKSHSTSSSHVDEPEPEPEPTEEES